MPKVGTRAQALLVLGALGVVFGDIGTSPLYAINELLFRDSTAAPSRAANGFAVAAVMLVTCVSVAALARDAWGWPVVLILAVFVPLAVIDGAFVAANSVKLFSGAWIPVVIGTVLALQMFTWRWGRERIALSFLEHSTMGVSEVIAARDERGRYFPKSMLMFVAEHPRNLTDPAPVLLERFWKR
ncbi:MAG: KUP/HAK/KT family potassium transporter [Acidimicrobiia bacterium]